MAEVRLVDLRKQFGDTAAVHDVNLHLADGELVCLLGPSGCGKTTTLRLIGGLEQEDDGDIEIDGRSMHGVPAWQRDCGIVFQNYALFPHMTVFDNMAYGPRLRRWPKPKIQERVQELARFVDITPLLARYPRQLSGGQQQRVAVARALAIHPKVLLMDEPLTGLDAKLRERVRFELRQIQLAMNITTIYVTHDQEEAFALADRVAIMNRGRIVQIGTPLEIYEHPSTAFTAEFIGSNNVLSGMVLEGAGSEGHGVVQVDAFTLRARLPAGVAPGQRVTLILRTTRLRVARRQAKPPTENGWCGKVIGRTFIGALVRLSVDVQGTLLSVDLQGEQGDYGLVAVGDDVLVSARPEDITCFAAGDTAAEQRASGG